MTTLLAIDTAADICSVALSRGNTIIQRQSSAARKHAVDVLPMIQSVLDESELLLTQVDAIVMVSGPGSFTGLRIGTAVAQGLSFGAEIPIVRISSLMMQARAAFNTCGQPDGTECVFYTCMHAREDEFYFACYQDDGVSPPRVLIEDQISDSKSILNFLADRRDRTRQHFRSGSGWLQQTLQAAGEHDNAFVSGDSANAATLCVLGKYALAAGLTDRAEDAVPVYLKEDMAYRKN